MPARAPLPGPSFLREQALHVRDKTLSVGMARPTNGPDGWWLALLWVADPDGVISFRDLAPAAGPPPEPPAVRLGPRFAGSMSGLILEEAGRLQFRVATASQPDDPSRPWECPVAVLVGIRFEPARAATLRPNEQAEAVLSAFRVAVEGLSRP